MSSLFKYHVKPPAPNIKIAVKKQIKLPRKQTIKRLNGVLLQGVSRPFIVGLVMLLLFLSLQTDWTATRSGSGGGRKADFRSSSAASPNPRGTTRERVNDDHINDITNCNDNYTDNSNKTTDNTNNNINYYNNNNAISDPGLLLL